MYNKSNSPPNDYVKDDFTLFLERIDIQDLLKEAGYTLYRRDGLRWPAYVRTDNNGVRIHGDKFIVTSNGMCCFQPPTQKNFNVISFIKNFPENFPEYATTKDLNKLVKAVCSRMLDMPRSYDTVRDILPSREIKPFNLTDYKLMKYSPTDQRSQKTFGAFLAPRGIDGSTQEAFKEFMYVAWKKEDAGKTYGNLSFPLQKPGEQQVVGLEQRGRQRADGWSYKGKAKDSNGSEGLWIANLSGTTLDKAQRILWFESAFDAMAYYQTHQGDDAKRNAVYVSTGGSPTIMQFRGMLQAAPEATHSLCFDNDMAGKQFVFNFEQASNRLKEEQIRRNPYDISDQARKEYLDTLSDPTNIFSGYADYLPKPLGELYAKYESAYEEYSSSRQSRLVCSDDLQDLKMALDTAHQAYKEGMYKTFGYATKIEREVPELPYKDWNDVILHKPDSRLVDLATSDGQHQSDDASQEQIMKSTFHR